MANSADQDQKKPTNLALFAKAGYIQVQQDTSSENKSLIRNSILIR